jgi:hypothetical protein
MNPQMLMQLMQMVQQMPPEQQAALAAQTGETETGRNLAPCCQ